MRLLIYSSNNSILFQVKILDLSIMIHSIPKTTHTTIDTNKYQPQPYCARTMFMLVSQSGHIIGWSCNRYIEKADAAHQFTKLFVPILIFLNNSNIATAPTITKGEAYESMLNATPLFINTKAAIAGIIVHSRNNIR